MTEKATKAIEGVIRRIARQQGLAVAKSRTRNPAAPDYGTYGLFRQTEPGDNWRSREHVAGDPNTGYGLNLVEVAAQVGVKVVYGPDGNPRINTWAKR
jgi:hypothetical protein